MTTSPRDELLVAIRAALIADATLIALFGGTPRVFDSVPVDSTGKVTGAFPYITMGDGDQELGRTNQCMDLSEVYMTLMVWSREPDGGQVAAIVAAIRDAAAIKHTLTGHYVGTATFESAHYMREPDGLTRRAVVTISFDTAPVV